MSLLKILIGGFFVFIPFIFLVKLVAYLSTTYMLTDSARNILAPLSIGVWVLAMVSYVIYGSYLVGNNIFEFIKEKSNANKN